MQDVNREYRIAWAAGFFDGEGCVSFRNGVLYRIDWAQKILSPIIELDMIFKTGHIYGGKNKCYRYSIFGKEAVYALVEMLPYLLVKKEKAMQGISNSPKQ